jgi:hypothetical protein
MLVAEVAIKLDLEFGQVDYAFLDEVIHNALHQHGLPVVDVEVEALRPADSPVPTTLGVMPLDYGQPYSPVPLGPPGPFGRGGQFR